jgi:hypothetical protein
MVGTTIRRIADSRALHHEGTKATKDHEELPIGATILKTTHQHKQLPQTKNKQQKNVFLTLA